MAVASLSRPRAAVVTALSLECDAVLAHLTHVQQEVHPTGTIFRVGKFQGATAEWDVATVVAGMHNVQAALETERIITHFAPQILLFCGVAGGLKDVALGDVVAATKVYWYEAGKDEQEFRPRPEVSESSYALVQRAIVVASESRWRERAGFAEAVSHPAAWVKPIAAGGKVVGSHLANSYLLLRQTFSDAVAVDMESFGFLRATYSHTGTLALAIRGISDAVEGKAEADALGGQPRAAAHAAAFAFQVLSEVTPAGSQASQNPCEPTTALLPALEQLAMTLYPLGPIDSQIWSRAGGDVGRLRFSGSGRADWHSAIQLLKNGGGGEKITAGSLMETMRGDFPNHPELARGR